MLELSKNTHQSAVIKVVGIGDGGCNAIHKMIEDGVDGLEYIFANTDAQALSKNPLNSKSSSLQFGNGATKGLGAGTNPNAGHRAALEDRGKIFEAVSGADLIFLIVGMGGGTGTGAAPVFADVAAELGILTVAIITTPFLFEGKERFEVADEGIIKLSRSVDSIITIPSEKALEALGKDASLRDAFRAINTFVSNSVRGITDLISHPGMINVDVEDLDTIFRGSGFGAAGVGLAEAGKDRARKAAIAAIDNPLLGNIDLVSAKNLMVNITTGLSLSLGEFAEVGDLIEDAVSDDATVVIGTVINPSMGDSFRVTIVVTGIDRKDRDHEMALLYASALPELDYVDIPAFLRKKPDNAMTQNSSDAKSITTLDALKLIVPKSASDDFIVELIQHLSNVYSSVGGDELVVHSVKKIPPSSNQVSSLESKAHNRVER